MRFIIITILFFIISNNLIYGQYSDLIKIKHEHEKYLIADTCYYDLKWNSLILPNKKIENTINTSIRNEVTKYIKNEALKLESTCDTNRFTFYEFSCEIVFANHKMISVYLSSVVDYYNGRAGEDNFKTINYNTRTGDIVNFNDLIRRNKITDFDNLIIQQMTETMKEYDEDTNNLEINHWKEQLNNIEYNLSTNGILIYITNQRGGYNANSWKQEIWFSHDEIKNYMIDKKLLK